MTGISSGGKGEGVNGVGGIVSGNPPGGGGSITGGGCGWPGRRRFMFVCMKVVERISLRYFSGKYRVTEGAPGSFLEPGSWG